MQRLSFQSLYEGNGSLQSYHCSSSSWVQGLKQQVPKQLDPEVALTQLGLQKPHILIAGFNALLPCVPSKLSSPM